ncbi:MAG TPA: hypothetical protein VIM41_15165 [Gammaproteobacteria bacterium]
MFQTNKHYLRGYASIIVLAGAVIAMPAFAGDMGGVMIKAPKDGATLSASGENKLEYEIKLGEGDDHFHVWVDGDRGGPVRDLKGMYTLPKMAPGKHAIIVKIVDKAHAPTGPEKSVFVKVE